MLLVKVWHTAGEQLQHNPMRALGCLDEESERGTLILQVEALCVQHLPVYIMLMSNDLTMSRSASGLTIARLCATNAIWGS